MPDSPSPQTGATPGIAAMPVATALFRAIQETLEVMFFVDVAPAVTKPSTSPDGASPATARPSKLWVEVGFEGTRRGCMRLGLEESLARFCHEGFQPDDEPDGDPFAIEPEFGVAKSPRPQSNSDSMSDASLQQSLLELGNIVCGAFLSSAWPLGLFQVKEPRQLSSGVHADLNPSYRLGVCCHFSSTEGEVEARVYFVPSAL